MSEKALTAPKLSHTSPGATSNNLHVHGDSAQQYKGLVTELNDKAETKHHVPAIHHEGDIKILKTM